MHAVNNANTRLTFGRYVGYGLGDLAFNFYWLPLNFFLMKYYTDVLGLPSATAGLITAVGLIWDAAIDPAIGVFANKTQSRFGRYRPYMLYGCVPLAASFTMMFYPMPLQDTALVVYAFAMQLLFRTAYAAVNIPYGAMMASMTRDSMERNWLAGARMFCAFSGSAIVGYYTPRLVGHFEAGQGEYAYFIATAILSGIAVVVTLLSFAFTREKIHDAGEIHSPVLQMLKMLAKNPPFLLAMAGIALFSFSNVVVSATLAYFVQYYMGQDKEVTGNVVGMIPLAQMCSIIPWTIASQYLGKRWAWITGLSIAIASLLVLFVIDQPSMQMVYVLFAIYAVGCGSLAVNFWSIVPDTVEYGEWRTGVRAEGFIFGFVTLIQKIALGLSSGFVGLYLSWIGYVANQAQTPATLEGLKTLITIIAVVGMTASCVVIYFYKLNTASHAQLVREIALRQKPGPA
jgi:GPH family glycoside/pentoside/hexuronide:cation symporter